MYLDLRKLPLPRGIDVTVRLDNSIVVSCLIHQGATQFYLLNNWVLSIFHVVRKKRIFIMVFHMEWNEMEYRILA